MPGFERRAWEERTRGERQARLEQQIAAGLARLRQAAVPMERLTGSDHWDTFLRLGEEKQEAARLELRQVTDRLAGLQRLTDDEMAILRHHAVVIQAQIQARQELLDLPKVIVQSAQSVQETK